ncbi:MAG: RIP metalloprotease RseP [Gammaproteobacteria bacterium]|nr:RIP metalloprotease RseP [Gammaproteobacteria bacterium]
MQFLQTVGAFILALGVLVTFHEYGHFWVARKLGVKILRFSVGFGTPIWSRRFGADSTEFAVAAIPLGGYVKMLDEREGEVEEGERKRAFNRQTIAVRAAIVVAGPLANFLLAFIVYWLIYMTGVSGPRPILGVVAPEGVAYSAGLREGDEIVAVNGRPTAIWDNVLNTAIEAILDASVLELRVRRAEQLERDLRLDFSGLSVDDLSRGDFFNKIGFELVRSKIPPKILQVVAGEAAAKAGLKAGDVILKANGLVIDDWIRWVEQIRASPGQPLAVTVQRDGTVVQVALTPQSVNDDGRLIGRIGAEVFPPSQVTPPLMATERYSILAAAIRALDRTWELTHTTLKFLRQMIVGRASLDNLSGPLSIAQFAGESAKLGLSRFLEFIGLVSVSLAVLNLLPIPSLDGGHLVFYLIEFLARRPVPEAVQLYGQQIGLVLLMSLMGLAIYNDLVRIF